ncbi:MAG: membrane protein insertion efficiency factor YidD [Candidatus Fermentibacteraceae bacterium]
MKSIIILMIDAYRKLLSPLLPSSCRFTPTCSGYARTAVERFGAWKGSMLALKRILRCNPWNSGGYDPVPEEKNNGNE